MKADNTPAIGKTAFNLSCPIPLKDYPRVVMAHGGGGSLTRELIAKMFAPAFANPLLNPLHDGAVFDTGSRRLAFTTDSHVVTPLFFPGGDIGSLAVNGTVNDLAMCGARPLYLSAGFVLEEGLSMDTLWQIVQAMKKAADAAGCPIVTGDTKVVDKGKGDGIYINTAGVGVLEHDRVIAPGSVKPGDAVLLSGDIGRHGIAIMAVREGLDFETTVESDCAPLNGIVQALLEEDIAIHCLRDLTRGGLASALVEIAESASLRMVLNEETVPVSPEVNGACEILGLDPLYVVNEGRFAVILDSANAERALEVLQSHPLGRDAARIGTVDDSDSGMVVLKTALGTSRILTLLSGEQLPRIC